MTKSILSFALLFILLILAQVLICNHIVIFQVGVAFAFIYFIIALPVSLPTNWLIALSFLAGFLVDVCSDTLGVNSLACTILAILKKPIFFAYVQRDDKTKVMFPSIRTLGWPVYTKYMLTMSAIYCVLAFSIEYFSFAAVKDILILSAASTVFTLAVCLAIGCLFGNRMRYE